jgi:hypothetical protein
MTPEPHATMTAADATVRPDSEIEKRERQIKFQQDLDALHAASRLDGWRPLGPTWTGATYWAWSRLWVKPRG